jgi:ribosomal protein L20
MSKIRSFSAAVLCAVWLLSGGLRSCPAAETPTAEQKIEQELEKPTQLEFIETPLQDVLDHLKSHHKIEIQVDRKALSDVGLDPSTLPITKNLKGLSLRSALELTLHDLDLTYLVQDEVLMITTPEEAETRLTTKFYPVADLIGSQDKSAEKGHRDELVHALTTTVEPTSWRSVGGPRSVASTSFHGAPTLAVSQTYQVHRRIAAFLEEQRRVVRAGREAAVPRCPVIDVGKTPAVKRIEKALKELTEFSFVETPLASVVDYLKKKHQIEIQIDRKSLADVGIDPSTMPITRNAKGISLRSALRLLLRDVDLTYVIEDEVLLITTPEEAETRLTVRIYAVGDVSTHFCPPLESPLSAVHPAPRIPRSGPKAERPGEIGPPADATADSPQLSASGPICGVSRRKTLADMICEIVEPTSWDAVGGPGSIVSGSIGGVDVLIVSQTQEVHEQILELIEHLREFVRCNRPTPVPVEKPAVDKPKPDAGPKTPPAPPPPAKTAPGDRDEDPFNR